MKKSTGAIVLSVLLAFSMLSVLNLHFAASDPEVMWVPRDYPTIQAAVDNANTSATIMVSAGFIDPGNIVVYKQLILQGEDNKALIDPAYSGDGIQVTASDVTISGFTIRNSNPSSGAGIRIEYCDDVNVTDCNITGNYEGVRMDHSDHCWLQHNSFSDNSYMALRAFYSEFTEFKHNTVLNNHGGIAMREGSHNANIWDNYFDNNKMVGIQIGSNYSVIQVNSHRWRLWHKSLPTCHRQHLRRQQCLVKCL